MTPYTPDGEIDFYKLWTDSQKRIAELEELVEKVRESALRKIKELS